MSIKVQEARRETEDLRLVQDFEILKPISRGAYGRVFLAKKISTGDIYAIKTLEKNGLKPGQVEQVFVVVISPHLGNFSPKKLEHIRAERNILASLDNPFVVRMYYSFQSAEKYYLVMEYLPGGDLHALLKVRTNV